MKIACLGGSFNPVHLGHLILAENVCCELGYDKVLFVPTAVPPHKQMAVEVSGQDRLNMVKLAIDGDDRFEAESCELDRHGVSYTFDTVNFLREKYKDVLEGKIGWIIGNDLVADFNKWHRADELARIADIIIAARPDDVNLSKSAVNKPVGNFGKGEDCLSVENFPYPHKIVHNPDVLISSSQIRQAVKNHGAFKYLAGEKVFDYILKEHLYED